MRFGGEIVFYTFPTRSFINGDGISSSVTVVKDCKSLL